MNRRTIWLWAIALPLAALMICTSGCTSTPNAPYAATPDDIRSGEAVLYGRFELDYNKLVFIFFENVNTHEKLFFHLTKDRPVRLTHVPAGTYRLSGAMLVARGLKSLQFSPDIIDEGDFVGATGVFPVKAGRAYYVGDFRAFEADVSFRGRTVGITHRDSFRETTDAVLAAAPWVDAMNPQSAWHDVGDGPEPPDDVLGPPPWLDSKNPQSASHDVGGGPEPPDDSSGAEQPDRGVALHGMRPLSEWINWHFGFAHGGDDLFAVVGRNGPNGRTLRAGSGYVLSMGHMWTPYWSPAYRNGLGLGLDGGVKFNGVGIDGETVSFVAPQLLLSLHYLRRLSDSWFVLAKTGLLWEPAVAASGGEVVPELDIDLGSAWGASGETGFYLEGYGLSFDLTLRYTRISHTHDNISVSGNSLGLFMGMHVMGW